MIEHVDSSHFPLMRLTVRLSDPSLLNQLRLTENGQPNPSLVIPSLAASQAIAVAVDTSNSMHGARLQAVLRAAEIFIRAQPQTATLAVYGFAAKSYVAAPFPASQLNALGALSQFGTGGVPGTVTYGLIRQVADDTSKLQAQHRVLVLITDGQSLRDTATIDQAISAAHQARLTIYPVAIVTPLLDTRSLDRIATATGGRLIRATSLADLSKIARSLAHEVSSTYTLSYRSYATPGAPIKLALSAHGARSAQTSLKAPGSAQPTTPSSSLLQLPTGLPAQIILTLGLIASLLAAAILAVRLSARF